MGAGMSLMLASCAALWGFEDAREALDGGDAMADVGAASDADPPRDVRTPDAMEVDRTLDTSPPADDAERKHP
jgi:hypothetical protein